MLKWKREYHEICQKKKQKKNIIHYYNHFIIQCGRLSREHSLRLLIFVEIITQVTDSIKGDGKCIVISHVSRVDKPFVSDVKLKLSENKVIEPNRIESNFNFQDLFSLSPRNVRCHFIRIEV